MTYVGKFGTIRLGMEFTMRHTSAEPGVKSFFEIFLLFSLIRLMTMDDLPYWVPT